MRGFLLYTSPGGGRRLRALEPLLKQEPTCALHRAHQWLHRGEEDGQPASYCAAATNVRNAGYNSSISARRWMSAIGRERPSGGAKRSSATLRCRRSAPSPFYRMLQSARMAAIAAPMVDAVDMPHVLTKSRFEVVAKACSFGVD